MHHHIDTYPPHSIPQKKSIRLLDGTSRSLQGRTFASFHPRHRLRCNFFAASRSKPLINSIHHQSCLRFSPMNQPTEVDWPHLCLSDMYHWPFWPQFTLADAFRSWPTPCWRRKAETQRIHSWCWWAKPLGCRGGVKASMQQL